MRHRQEIQVPFAYDVVFTRGLFAPENTALAETLPHADGPAHAAFFIDQGVLSRWPDLPDRIEAWAAAHPDVLVLRGSPVAVPGGEQVKNDLSFVQRMTHQFQRLELDRHNYVFAVGGGAVLDAVGLAAGVFHRGIRLVRVPTTVLSQNDSGVGVKNGINLDGVKNLIGTFAPPYAVLSDLEFLTTLDDRDWFGGLAETFKVALIKDAALLDELEALAPRLAARDLDAMARMVERCAILHLQHIRDGGDPFECGSARPLDFGHWSAHKLEALTHHELRHGEAVAIGIALDLCLAADLGHITPAERERALAAMQACRQPLWHPMLAKRNGATGKLKVAEGLEEFRQHLGGRLTLTLPDGIGRKLEIHALEAERIERAVAELAARFAGAAAAV